MDAKRTDLPKHTSAVSKVLAEVCGAPQTEPLVRAYDESSFLFLRISDRTLGRSRTVTNDLGQIEPAVRLSISAGAPLFWLGLHERWEQAGRHKIRFQECAVRLYLGALDEDAVQVLRLEWVAPVRDPDGLHVYQGKHAGHPHWHLDKSALVGEDEYTRSLELLTASGQESDVEFFGPAAAVSQRLVHDCSWIPRIHLPAQAGWMHADWDAEKVPGPHQSEPDSIMQLDRWWTGALRYLRSELANVAI